MPRKTPVQELLKEEEVPTSPLRRSSRITNNVPASNNVSAPTKVLTRRNSSSDSTTSTSTPKVTRSRRSSLTQESESSNDAQPEKKKTTSTVRTRRGSLTQNNENQPEEGTVAKTRSRGSSVPKDQKAVEVKKPVRRRKSITEDQDPSEEEAVEKRTRSRSSSFSKKSDASGGTPVKKSATIETSSESLDSIEEGSKEVDSPDKVVSSSFKRRTDVVKIDLDLSVINETSLTEETSPQKESMADKKTSENLEIHQTNNEKSPELTVPTSASKLDVVKKSQIEETSVVDNSNDKLITEENNVQHALTEVLDNTVSENSFKLQLSSSALEDNNELNEVVANNSGNKENVCPKTLDNECEPMDVDDSEIEEISPVEKISRLSLVKKVTEVDQKLQIAEKITNEIDEFLKEKDTLSSLNKGKQIEESKVLNENLSVNVVTLENNSTITTSVKEKISTPSENGVLTEETSSSDQVVSADITEVVLEKNLDVVKTAENSNDRKDQKSSVILEEKENLSSVDVDPLESNISQTEASKENIMDSSTNINSSLIDTDDVKVDDTDCGIDNCTEVQLSSVDVTVTENVSTSNEVPNETGRTKLSEPKSNIPPDEKPKHSDQKECSLSQLRGKSEDLLKSEFTKSESINNSVANDESVPEFEKTDIGDKSEFEKNKSEKKHPDGYTAKNTELQDVKQLHSNEEQALEVKGVETKEAVTTDKTNREDDECTECIESEQNESKCYKSPVKEFINRCSAGSSKTDEEKRLASDECTDSASSQKQNTAVKTTESDGKQKDESEVENVTNIEDEIVGKDNNISILSQSSRKRSLDRTSITLQETVRAGEDKEKTVSERIHKVVDLFCAGIKNNADVSINVSLEYTGQLSDTEDEKTDLLEVSLVASTDVAEQVVDNKRGSKRRKICHDDSLQSLENEEGNNEASPKDSDKSGFPDNLPDGDENNLPNRCDDVELPKGSAKKSKKRKSLTSGEILPVMKDSPKKSADVDEFNKVTKKTNGVTALKSPKSKVFLDDEKSDLDESTDNENGAIVINDESSYKVLLSASFEENDDSDTTWQPQDEKIPTESEGDDSDDSLEESFVKEVISKQSYENSTKRRTTAKKIDQQISSNVTPEKKKKKKRNDDDSSTSKMLVAFEEGVTKSNKLESSSDGEEPDKGNITKTSRFKENVKGTPYKRAKVEVSSEEESSGDMDQLIDNNDSVVSESDEDSKYNTLLVTTFEDSDADTTWRPDKEEGKDDSATDESSSGEEESFIEEAQKLNLPSVLSPASDNVFEHEDEIPVAKPKRRKMLRLSKFNVSNVLKSSDSEENVDNTAQIKKTKHDKDESSSEGRVHKKNRRQTSIVFEETEHVKNILPESSEVKSKNKKRKLSSVIDEAALHPKSKTKKVSVTDLRERINKRNLQHDQDDERSDLNMKPSKKASDGWDVTKLS